ncbi:FAD binding domain-containing protein [Boletus edulis]|nr:FAD binding domain-containing protein [Boletus edulis]
MMPSDAPVLVAGGGPSGLVAALTLLQNNIPVRIVTKELEYRLGQRGNGVWPRTFEVFHFLRAFGAHQSAQSILPVREYRPGTLDPCKTFTVVPHNDPTPSIPYNNPMFLGQPTLEAILRSHIENYGCSVELGTELLSFEDDGERILAKLVKRKDGEETFETFEASYLVGADGAKSITRKQLGLAFLGETVQDFGCVVGDLCLEIEGVDRKHWHFFGDRSSDFFNLRPTDEIAPDGFQFLIAVKDHDPQQLLADQHLMVKCMSALTGHEINIRKVDALSVFRPNIRMVDKFGSGRVFIVGDAAHVHSPTGGQGLNTGIQDAFNLAWKLSLVHKGLSPITLLDSYTTERLPVIAEMLNITTGIFNKVRLATSTQSAMEREKRMNMLGVNCRSSPVVLDEFTQAEPVSAYGLLEEGMLVAGDRAPDATKLGLVVARATGGVETTTRLFDVFSPVYHTVLVFAPDAASSTDVLDVLRRYPKDVIRPAIVLPQDSDVTTGAQVDLVVDHDGHAYRGYLAEKGKKKVVVVRPDGVVGAMVHGAEGVEAYFAKIFSV